MEVDLKVLRSCAELEGVRAAWDSWPGNRDSEIDYYLTVLRSSPKIERPHVLLIRRGGVPDAILVGRIDHSSLDCKVGYLHLRLKAKILYFVYGAFRGSATIENSELFIAEIMRSLALREADVAYLNFLDEKSNLWQVGRRKPGFLSRDHVHGTQPHFAISIPATVEEFYRSLSPRFRAQARNKHRKLVARFAKSAAIHCFEHARDIDEMMHTVEQVAMKSYQRGLGVGFVDDLETRERLRLKCEKGWLRCYVLYIATRPAAFWIGDINGRVFGSDYLAYDPEFARYSPGMYLIMKVIESFCDGSENIAGVDFGTGQAQYKEVLSNQTWYESPVYIFAPTIKGQSLTLARFVSAAIDTATKRALLHMGLLRQLKRAWRARVTRNRSLEAENLSA